MASSDELTAWVNRFGRAFLRYVRLLQLLAGLFLMVFGYYIGRAHFDLIVEGSRTQGRIVDYKEERIGNRIGTFLPGFFLSLVAIKGWLTKRPYS